MANPQILFKRGTTAQADAVTPDSGEPLYDETLEQLRMGDGSTAGGKKVVMQKARWHEVHGQIYNSATVDLIAPTANLQGGHELNNAADLLYYTFHIHEDWNGNTDPKIDLIFELPNDNSGGAGSDTVDIKIICYYKGEGDVVTKSQILEVATVIGAAAQYTQFVVEFTIDYDAVSNVLEVEDVITLVVNLETDTSEVDDIIISHLSLKYQTEGLEEV